jgi:hypothetical protein
MNHWPESLPWHDGERKEFNFKYHVISLVKFTGSYGWRDDLWELAILDKDTEDFVDLPIDALKEYPAADVGVYGFLNDAEADRIINEVRRYDANEI